MSQVRVPGWMTFLMAALLSLGCGSALAPTAMTAPTATPFAPEDLALTLPREVSGVSLEVDEASAEDVLGLGPAGEAVRRLLVDTGKSASDVTAATATGRAFTQEVAKELTLFAVRVRGVPADRIASLMYQSVTAAPSLLPSTVAGKSVLQISNEDQNVLRYFYVNGEVFYGIIATGLPTPDVAAALASAALDALP